MFSAIDDELDEAKCLARGCIWDEIQPRHPDIPSCFFNFTKVGYRLSDTSKVHAGKILNLTTAPIELTLDLLDSTKQSAPKFQLLPKLTITFTAVTGSILRFQIKDPSNPNRYQVPIQETFPLLNAETKLPSKLGFTVQVADNANHFGFKVIRTLDDSDVM